MHASPPLLITALLGLLPLSPLARSDEPLNVLLIAVDDLRPELGCYGVAHAPSPCLDRFAAGSVVFTNHFAQVPTCAASRYALLTGRSPARTGATASNDAFHRAPTALDEKELEGAQSLPELFRRSGYRTVCIGKISHTPDGRLFAYDGTGDGRDEVPHAWDQLSTPFGPWKRGWGAFFAYAGGRHREDGGGHCDRMEFIAKSDEELPDGRIAHEAVATLERLAKEDDPFFLAVGFYKPHLPFVATEGDWEAALQLEVPPPPHGEEIGSSYGHRSGEFHRYTPPHPETRPLSIEDRVHSRRAYLACVRFVDRQIGKVLDALDAQGLRESTVVVLWSDHGWHLGDSGIWGKHTPFERALRSPLMIRAPGISRDGLRCDGLVESIDLWPTLLEICTPSFVRAQHELDGRSLRPLLTGESKSVRDVSFSYWRSAISLRTSTHRLIVTRKAEGLSRIELYDVTQTPDPIENLSEREPELVKQLLDLLPPDRSR
jgi:arylsulfatase A-like enzyme